jgi:hypothetical protein
VLPTSIAPARDEYNVIALLPYSNIWLFGLRISNNDLDVMAQSMP